MIQDLHALIGYPLFLVAGLELLLGYILLRQNARNSPENKAAAMIAFFSSAFALSTAVMYVHASLGLPYNLFARTAWIGWFCIPAALHFLAVLDARSRRASRFVGFALYPFWTVVFLVTVFTDLVVSDVYELIPFRNEPGPLEKPLRLLASLLILWIIVKATALRKRSSGVLRKELNLFLTGIIVFGGGAALTAGVLQLFHGVALEPGLASYFSLPWVALTFYAISRYQLFDIRMILSKTISALLLLTVFSVIQAGLFLLLEQVLGHVLSLFITLAFLGVLVFGTRLSGSVEQWVNALVAGEDGASRNLLRSATHRLSSLLLLDELLDQLTAILCSGLRAEEVRIYLERGDGLVAAVPRREPEGAAADRLPPDLARRLSETGQPVVLGIERSLVPDAGADRMVTALRAIRSEIALPLVTQGRLIGALTLGPRSSGPFSQADLLLLETLAAQAAASLANSLLFQETLRIKESLRESEERFRALAETAPAAIVIHRAGPLLYANQAAEQLFCCGRDALLARSLWDFVHPEDVGAVRDRSARVLAGGEPAPAREFRIHAGVAEPRWVIGSAGPMEFRGRRALVATLIDVTERRRLEGRVRYLQKMETIGKLAGGIAHDFNNVLTTIVGQTGLLQMELPRDHPLRGSADKILSASERASALVLRLLSYGSRKSVSLQPGDLNELLHAQEHLLAGVLPPSIRLAVDPSLRPLPVMLDRGQLERVLLNLAVNARDAMPDGGLLSLSAGEATIDAAFISCQGFGKSGRYAFLAVQDTGTGMEEAVRKRIFEPFFTTKSAGKGTGFGLSIVYDIVKEHQGYITVQSEPGKGSRFTAYIPLAHTAPEESGTALPPDDRDASAR